EKQHESIPSPYYVLSQRKGNECRWITRADLVRVSQPLASEDSASKRPHRDLRTEGLRWKSEKTRLVLGQSVQYVPCQRPSSRSHREPRRPIDPRSPLSGANHLPVFRVPECRNACVFLDAGRA